MMVRFLVLAGLSASAVTAQSTLGSSPDGSENRLNRAIESLTSGDAREQRKAILTLGSMGAAAAPAIPRLIDLLEDREVASAARTTLSRIGAAAIPPLLRAMGSKKWQVSSAARGAILEMPADQKTDRLLLALSDPGSTVRRNTIRALRGLHEARVTGPLIEVLDTDASPDVRSEAAIRLGEMEDVAAIEPLLEALYDPSGYVRKFAASSLANLGALDAVEPLIDLLRDESARVREHSLKALEALGDLSAVKEIGRVLVSDRDSTVRADAADALGSLRTQEARAALIGALRNDEDFIVRDRAASNLRFFENTAVVEALIQALGDRMVAVRKAASYALGEIGNPMAIGALIERLEKDEDQRVRGRVAIDLSKLTGKNYREDVTLWRQWWLRNRKASAEGPASLPPGGG